MGSPAVTPSASAAPSSPAPSAPAPSAPSSSPAATPSPASPPVPATPSSEPAAPSAPAAPAPFNPQTSPTAPKAADFPNTPDGQTEFMTKHRQWKQAHPEGEKAPDAAAPVPPAEPAKTPEEQALADAAAPDKPAEGAAEPPATPDPAATPQTLAKLMTDVPEFGQFLETEGGKKVKGQIFSMARELAGAKPVLEIFPSVDDAKFAQEYATSMVGLKTASMRLIDNPDSAGDFLSMFDSQFAQLDDKGQPVLKDGKPVYDPDRDVVRGAMFKSVLDEKRAPLVSQIGELEGKLKGTYPSEFVRQQDQQKLDNLQYAQTALEVLDQIVDGSFFEAAPPEPPADATPEVKAWYEQQKAEFQRQKDELKAEKQGASKEERAGQRTQFSQNVRSDMGAAVGTVIGNALKAAVESGVYIPQFYLQEKFVDPATGRETSTQAIAVRIFQKFEDKLMAPGSRTSMDIVKHELLPQTEQTRQMRKDWYARQAATLVPDIVQAEVDRIQGLVKLDQDKQAELLGKRRQVAAPEPHTGGSALPHGASREQIMQAAEQAAAKDKDWEQLSPDDKQTRLLTHFNRLRKK